MTEKKKRSSDRLNILLFFYRKQFIQLKPIRAMISELSDRIWRSRVRLAPRPLRQNCARVGPLGPASCGCALFLGSRSSPTPCGCWCRSRLVAWHEPACASTPEAPALKLLKLKPLKPLKPLKLLTLKPLKKKTKKQAQRTTRKKP